MRQVCLDSRHTCQSSVDAYHRSRDRAPPRRLGRTDRARRPVRHVRDRRARRPDAGVRRRPAAHARRSGRWPAAHGDKDYIVYEDERYTYAEIDAQVRALAHHLRDAHGVGSGDRVALAMRNYPEWVVGYWATCRIGAAVVGMNAWWTTPEMEYGLADSPPEGADRRRRAARAGAARARRAARRRPAARDRRALRPRRCPTTPLAGPTWSAAERAGRAARRRRSTPTTTPRSSTRRAPPGSRRAPSSPTAARCTTSCTWSFWTTAVGAGRGQGHRRRRRPAPSDPAAPLPPSRCSWPRRRCSTSPRATACCTRARWPAARIVLTYKWDAGPGPRADRARAGDQLLRRARR